MNELIERLRNYNPPDRTVDEQRQIAIDIQDAAKVIEQQQTKIAELTKQNEWRVQLEEFKKKFGEDANIHYERDIEFLWQRNEKQKAKIDRLTKVVEAARKVSHKSANEYVGTCARGTSLAIDKLTEILAELEGEP